MVKASVKVCIRTRPTQCFAADKIQIDGNQNTLQIQITPEEEDLPTLNNKQNTHKYKFDDVYHNVTQSQVYDQRARNTVIGVIEGINGAILTYGQTGSGKTFTMLGDTSNYELRGLAPRALTQIFHEINTRIEYEYKVFCSYMEIYNDRIFDLLDDLSNPNQNPEYTITEDKEGKGTYVRGVNEIEIHNEREALNLLFGGELARTTATHKLNKRSNRSHAIFTVTIQKRQRSGSNEKIVHSKLILVDLAGSERLKKTMDDTDGVIDSDGEAIKRESMAINQSLSYLEQCVVALSRKGQVHVPYRQSKLTNILKDCLGANCNTLVIACIWGESAHLEETISTLRFASRMMKVENDISQIETIDSLALIKKQAREIKALKQELLMHDALVERTGIVYEPFTPEQQLQTMQLVERYVDVAEGESEELLNITSVRQMVEICKQFKTLVLNTRQELEATRNEIIARAMSAGKMSPGSNNINNDYYDSNGMNNGNNIGDLNVFGDKNNFGNLLQSKIVTIGVADDDKNRKGFSLGLAAPDSKPPTGILKSTETNNNIDGNNKNNTLSSNNKNKSANINNNHQLLFASESEPFFKQGNNKLPKDVNYNSLPEFSPTHFSSVNNILNNDQFNTSLLFSNNTENTSPRTALFQAFAKNEGFEKYNNYIDCKSSIKETKIKLKEMSQRLNEAKNKIDELNVEFEKKKEFKQSNESPSSQTNNSNNNNNVNNVNVNNTELIDDEEFRLLKELKDTKLSYKNAYNQFQKFKSSLLTQQETLENLKSSLVESFLQWSGSPSGQFFSLQLSTSEDVNEDNNKSPQTTFEINKEKERETIQSSDEWEKLNVIANHPESIHFFNAQKTKKDLFLQNSSSIKLMKKIKRLR